MKNKIFKNIPFIIAEHAFWACLILFFFSLAMSLFLFYRYDYLANKKLTEEIEEECVFRRDLYEEVLSTWEQQELLFNIVDSKEYINPFLKPVD
jgi:hypothetical protein